MKITTSTHRSRRGSAVIVVLALLAIIIIFVTASFTASKTLSDELKLIDKRQRQHWQPAPPAPAKPPVNG